MRAILAVLVLASAAPPAAAQSEDLLRTFFEGKIVHLKLEMPGTSQGVDVYPGTERPIDFPKHAGRLKEYGTALRRGDEAMITKIRVKKDLIEFRPKTEREKNLEKDVDTETDPAQRRKLREELDALRRDRQREDARNQAEAALAQQAKEANIRQRRLEGGSRFNLRYKPVVSGEALTPDGMMLALAEYVDFSADAGASAGGPGGRDELRKGLTVEEVDAMLGRPETIAQRMEGTLAVSTSSYRTRGRRITAEFVEGVLIRFAITPL